MTLPVVPTTALLGDADLHIRLLAQSVDTRLGAGYKFVPVSGSFEVNANGDITITVPMGGLVTGAVCQVARNYKAAGQVANAPPVPPASIGALIPNTLVNIFPLNFSPGPDVMWFACRTSAWQGTTNGKPTGYGSQPVKEGTLVPVIGLAWGKV